MIKTKKVKETQEGIIKNTREKQKQGNCIRKGASTNSICGRNVYIYFTPDITPIHPV